MEPLQACGNTSLLFHVRGTGIQRLLTFAFFLKIFSKYSLKEILNVEENHDVLKGDRYLIDLVSEYNMANFN